MTVSFGTGTGTFYPGGYFGTDDGAAAATFRIDNVYNFSVSVTGTVSKVGDTVTMTYGADAPAGYAGTTITLTAASDSTNQILFTSTAVPPGADSPPAASYRYVFSNVQMYGSGDPNRTRYTADGNDTTFNDYAASPPCFVTGTRIRVMRAGAEQEVAVETLQVGDRAVTASGALRAVTWIGHRAISRRMGTCRHDDQPIRVAANAFGAGLPARDLFLSPGHPVLVGADADNEGGHLVPIMCLVNGTTIERTTIDEVTYWHVELDAHDILLAEGLPAESYLDWGDRPFFSEAESHALMNPDFVVPGLEGRCRPVAIDGPVVDAERRRLDAVFAGRLDAASAWPGEDAWVL